MSLSCLQVVSCCIPSSVFWFIRSRSSSLVINIQGSSPVPRVCSKHSPGETEALRGVGGVVPVLVVSLADGAGHVYKAALGQTHAPCPQAGGEWDALHQNCCQPHTGGLYPWCSDGSSGQLWDPALLWPCVSSPVSNCCWEFLKYRRAWRHELHFLLWVLNCV